MVAVVAAVSLAGCAGGGSSASQGPVSDMSGMDMGDNHGLHGIVLPKPYAVPDLTLSDSSGRPYDLATDATKPLTLVFFGYTHCPDVCGVVMANIASALTRLDAGQRSHVQMLFVTTDPARDDVATLHGYVRRFDPTFDGLTGKLSTIATMAKAFGVPIEKGARLASGGYDVSHGVQVVGVLPDHRAPYVWTETTDPASMAADFITILDDKVPGQ